MHKSFYLTRNFYLAASSAVLIFIASFFIPELYSAGWIIIWLLLFALVVDSMLIYSKRHGLTARRLTSERFSNGDENKVMIRINNHFPFRIQAYLIDELPAQFQQRNWRRTIRLLKEEEFILEYSLKPLTRGEYVFGNINIYAKGPLKLARRRFTFEQEELVKVYPSFVQMRKFQLLAVSNKLQEAGIKKIRRLGHSMEFEQIKDYVRGDDYRTVNWKATARKGDFMVNSYTDERSQQIYCLINKGRIMKMPFDGMYLLDYAINASLVLCNVALARQDKAGLITFSENLDVFIPAGKKPTQINLLMEALYNQRTRFLEPDLEKLFSVIRNRINHRSLLVMFTNYESLESLQRELPSLKRIAHYHLLLVVIFENTELKQVQSAKAVTLEDIYIKTIVDKFSFEKKLMIKELQKNGILSILTTPGELTVNVINKYLEIKNRSSL